TGFPAGLTPVPGPFTGHGLPPLGSTPRPLSPSTSGATDGGAVVPSSGSPERTQPVARTRGAVNARAVIGCRMLMSGLLPSGGDLDHPSRGDVAPSPSCRRAWSVGGSSKAHRLNATVHGCPAHAFFGALLGSRRAASSSCFIASASPS